MEKKWFSEQVNVAFDVELALEELIRSKQSYTQQERDFLTNRTLRILREENNKHYGQAMLDRREDAREWFEGVKQAFGVPCKK